MNRKESAPTASPDSSGNHTSQSQTDSPVKKAQTRGGGGVKSQTLHRNSTESRDSKLKTKGNGKPGNNLFPVVGIGASAGGLEAFTQLLKSLPNDIGMAFVLIQHLDPAHESVLPEILSRASAMPVSKVEDGMPVEPDHVYVIPPNTTMGISGGALNLMTRTKAPAMHMPVDHFLRSLAEDRKDKAIGVILSGSGSDGAMGIEAIKAEGGITFAQNFKSAKYDGMPRGAVATDCVDFIMPPEEIAGELIRIGRHPYMNHIKAEKTEELPSEDEDGLNRIFASLRTAAGADLSYYKPSTVSRRIARRMALCRIESLDEYAEFLKANPAEVKALYQDIFIKVTGFFRNPQVFEALKSKVFPSIMKDKPHKDPVRVWVPGCSTGEEAYSIAISLLEFLGLEFLGDTADNTPIQIFATDIDETVIGKARAGAYVANIAADVSPERLRRFFVEANQGYQIAKFIREMCVFSKHDVTRDSPFSRLDLISCRNMLIYLKPALQKKVIQTFHYSLKPAGFFLQGNSGGIAAFSDLFSPVDKKHRIYLKKPAPPRLGFNFAFGGYTAEKKSVGETRADVRSQLDAQKEADRILLTKYAPAGVIIDNNMEIIQFRGQTGPYLQPAPGRASFNLLKMARKGLLLDLREAVEKAKKDAVTVRKKGLKVRDNDEFKEVNIEVIPINVPSGERCFLVLFSEEPIQPSVLQSEAMKTGRAKSGKVKQDAKDREIARLQQELVSNREHLQLIIDEQEAYNEELTSANEEILSGNEELQSMNEELETAQEELQAMNEELNTINQELNNRNVELGRLNDDLNNLLTSVNIAIVMLGSDLRIRRLTPISEKVLNLIPADVGRPIDDMKLNVPIPDLEQLVSDVTDTMSVKEREVQDRKGHWYHMQIRPYKTADKKIDGAVMTLLDIDPLKRSMGQLKEARDYAEAIVETVREPLVVLDADLRVKTANGAFYETFHVRKEETENKFIYELGNGQWNIPKLRTLLDEILPKSNRLQDFEIDHEFERIGHRTMLLNARQIRNENDDTKLILLAVEDITEHKRGEDYIKASLKEKEVLLKEIHHRVKNNLQIISSLLNLQSRSIKDEEAREKLKESQNRVRSMALIHEKLYQSGNLAGIKLAEYIKSLSKSLFNSYRTNPNIGLKIDLDDGLMSIDKAIPCGLVVNEILSNSLKHAFPEGGKGEIRIALSLDNDKCTLTIGNDGIPFPEDVDFRNTQSLGFQLICALVDQLKGAIELQRNGGTEFKITFDLGR